MYYSKIKQLLYCNYTILTRFYKISFWERNQGQKKLNNSPFVIEQIAAHSRSIALKVYDPEK